LHYSQIYNLGKKELSHLTEEHVQNVLHSDSTTYLYDRGKYGLLKHLMLTDDVVEEIARLFKLVIESGPSDREWHCRELLDYLPNEVLPQNADINQYTADIVMKVCNAGRTLKRMVWVSSSSQKYRRLETLDTCAEDILLQAGGPMTNEELMARLTELRGSRWQKYAQQVLAANNRMIRIDENLWGLTDRDLHIGKDAAQEFLNSLFHLLSSTRQLHITKVSSVLPEVEKLELNPTLIAQLAKADGRFRCTRSMHLVLNVSDSVQALSILAAIKLVLQESTSPMELPKLTARVSDMIGHEVNSKSLTPHLYKLAKLAVVVKTDTDKRRGWVLNRSKRN
jgi:hypothetical protein